MNPLRSWTDEAPEVARDLCLGIGGFFAAATGAVHVSVCEVMAPEDSGRRISQLARACLDHPAAHGHALFWHAEAEPADRALACIAAPVWGGGTRTGVLGVVDLRLPELDDEQRAGLTALARSLASRLAVDPDGHRRSPDECGARAEAAVAGGPVALVEESTPADVPAPGGANGACPVPIAGTGEQFATERVSTERRPDDAALDVAEPFLGEVLDNLPFGLVVTRSDGAVVLANQTFSWMTELPVDEVLGEDVSRIFAAEASVTTGDRTDQLADLLGRSTRDRRLQVDRQKDAPLSVDANGRRLWSRYAGDCFVTVLRGAQTSSERLADGREIAPEMALDALEDGIISCDRDGVVLFANRVARTIHGLPSEGPLAGSVLPALTGLCTSDGAPLAPEAHPLRRAIREGSPCSTLVLLRTGGDAAGRCLTISARPLGRGGAVAVMRDVTPERRQQEQLAHYALHDPLTGLANRHLLAEELGRMLQGLARRTGSVALVFLDLDGFKEVNDAHGHDVGDEVLEAVARRLQGVVRGDDVVARLGGDEFVIAHATSGAVPDGDMVVGRIRKVLSAPYRLRGRVLHLGVSAGWIGTTSSEIEPGTLIGQADQAMYLDKRRRGTGAGGGHP